MLTDLPEIRAAVETFGDYIASQVLADSITLSAETKGNDFTDLEIDGIEAYAKVIRK